MRAAALSLVLLCPLALVACGDTIASLNARPDRHYQQKVSFIGQVGRLERLTDETLLELVGERGARILVKTTQPIDVQQGDWVAVDGLLVPDARVGDAILYDVVVAERVTPRGPPRIPDIM